MKCYALKGINDDQTECSVCGKVELRRVMWLVELDSDGNELGQPFHCGTTCGAKLLGYTQGKMRTTVDNYPSKVAGARWDLYMRRLRELGREQLLKQLDGLNFKERQAHPLWAEYRMMESDAHAWADNQPILITL